MSVVQIKQTIKTKLEAMQGINLVKDYATSTVDGEYPLAILTVGDGSGSVNANVRSLTTYGFNIGIFIESATNFTPEKAERIAVELIDEMTEAFRMDTTLSGTVSYCDQLEWETGYEIREHNTRVVNFKLNVNKIEILS